MPDRLSERPFSWRTRGAEVEISYGGRPVTVLRGHAAALFGARMAGLNEVDAQHLMARATGNFKRGNER